MRNRRSTQRHASAPRSSAVRPRNPDGRRSPSLDLARHRSFLAAVGAAPRLIPGAGSRRRHLQGLIGDGDVPCRGSASMWEPGLGPKAYALSASPRPRSPRRAHSRGRIAERSRPWNAADRPAASGDQRRCPDRRHPERTARELFSQRPSSRPAWRATAAREHRRSRQRREPRIPARASVGLQAAPGTARPSPSCSRPRFLSAEMNQAPGTAGLGPGSPLTQLRIFPSGSGISRPRPRPVQPSCRAAAGHAGR